MRVPTGIKLGLLMAMAGFAALAAVAKQQRGAPAPRATAKTKAGHGVGKPVTKQIEEYTDIYSFLFWQLGVVP